MDIDEIAHALSNICRFGGHVPIFYSVAQHSVHVSECLEEMKEEPGRQLTGLLHDAAEAYLGDMIRPLKYSGFFDGFKTLEQLWERAIEDALNIELSPLPSVVKIADDRLLITERRDLLVSGPEVAWSERSYSPWEKKIVPLEPVAARRLFLGRFAELAR